jgi:hypothetical protein
MTHFTGCKTTDEIKTAYRNLAQIFHPDHGGDTAIMQDINAEYSAAMSKAIRNERPGLTEQEYADLDKVNDIIRQAVQDIVNLPEITVEICGLWVWVSGNTYPVKDAIKAAGYRWANQKKMWYYAGVPASSHGKMDMDDIRSAHGSVIVKGNGRLQLAAA